jgi:signal transduction histidine kinase
MSLFRIIQEAINNVAKHAGARHVAIRLTFQNSVAHVVVADDGRGFDVERVLSPGTPVESVGLLGMQERVRLLNGLLRIRSQLGEGTELSIEIPIETEPA